MIQHAQSLSRALTIATVMSLIATAGWSQQPSITWLSTLGGGFSAAFGVSANGSVVVGLARDADGYDRAFRWTVAGGMQDLGTLGGDLSQASGVSADGTVVVGWAESIDRRIEVQIRAFRWTPLGGMEDLNRTYARLLTDGSILIAAYGISSDGRYIVGMGYNAATERTEAYLLDTIPEPASLIALGAGLVGLFTRRRKR